MTEKSAGTVETGQKSEEAERFYFFGIGGTAMGNLAAALAKGGAVVGGSDRAVYPPISEVLKDAGIDIDPPENTAVLEGWKEGVFIVGNAVSRGHPQVEWLLRNPTVRRFSFSEFVGSRFLRQTRNLVVAGTHGKSTTTALAAHFLRSQSRPVGWFVGGVQSDGTDSFLSSGEDRLFVIEGDEYDSAFFDKRAKFVHYRPTVLLLNNLEFDHADIYRDIEDVQRSFRQVISLVPGEGIILYNGDDPALSAILPVSWTRCLSFGLGSSNDFRVHRSGGPGIEIESRVDLLPDFRIRTKLRGAFNARNCAGAVIGARLLDPEIGDFGATVDLTGFSGLRRRQEVLFEDSNRILIEDFGHHPTAIKLAIESFRELYPGWTLHAMVEPRSNTMRTIHLEDQLIEALREADQVTLAPVHRADSVPEKMRLSPVRIGRSLATSGRKCSICDSMKEVEQVFVDGLSDRETLTIVFSNGSFGGLLPRMAEMLRQSVA